MGIYVFNASAMFEALAGDSTDFGKEIIPSLVGDKDLRSHVFDGYWEDIGTVRSFFEANLQLTDEVPSFDFYDEDYPIYNYPDILPRLSSINVILIVRRLPAGAWWVGLLRQVHARRRSLSGTNAILNVVMMGVDFFVRKEASLALSDDHGKGTLGVGVGDELR